MTVSRNTRLTSTSLLHDIENALTLSVDPWGIDADSARALASIVVGHAPKNVLEFGTGLSSLVLARALARSGGYLTSVESSPPLPAKLRYHIEITLAVDFALTRSSVKTTLDLFGLRYRQIFKDDTLSARGPYDTVFIDARRSFYTGDMAMHACYRSLTEDALILIHDSDPVRLAAMVRRLRRMWPCMRPATFADGAVPTIHAFSLSGTERPKGRPWLFGTNTIAYIRCLRARVRYEKVLRDWLHRQG